MLQLLGLATPIAVADCSYSLEQKMKKSSSFSSFELVNLPSNLVVAKYLFDYSCAFALLYIQLLYAIICFNCI